MLALFVSLKNSPDNEMVEYKRPCRIDVPSAVIASFPSVLDGSHPTHLTAANYTQQEWVIGCTNIIDTMSQTTFGRVLLDGDHEVFIFKLFLVFFYRFSLQLMYHFCHEITYWSNFSSLISVSFATLF